VEPDPFMRRRLTRRIREAGSSAIVLNASADNLPVEDDEFDTVVTSFVLCSVQNIQDALREIVRVLAPGGVYLFLEHVLSLDRRVAEMQENAPIAYSCIGCHPDRDIEASIEKSDLCIESCFRGEVPGAPIIERPLIMGTARKPLLLGTRLLGESFESWTSVT